MHVLKKSMLGTVYFLKIAKINSQQKNSQKLVPAKHTQKTSPVRKNFVPHGGQNSLVIPLMIPLLTT